MKVRRRRSVGIENLETKCFGRRLASVQTGVEVNICNR